MMNNDVGSVDSLSVRTLYRTPAFGWENTTHTSNTIHTAHKPLTIHTNSTCITHTTYHTYTHTHR